MNNATLLVFVILLGIDTGFVRSSDTEVVRSFSDSSDGRSESTSARPVERSFVRRTHESLERSAVPAPAASAVRLPGEFERQQFLLLSCGELTPNHADMIAAVAQETRRQLRVIVLYSSDEQKAVVDAALRNRMDTLEDISLLRVPHDTKWIRDYGPTVLQTDAGFRVIDWLYEHGRPSDERVPEHMAAMSQTPYELGSIVLHGGNLLSNGQGVCVTTLAVLNANGHLGITKADLPKQLGRRIGAREIVVLEPLVGEPTGHVDMFATFTGPNTVVVGQYSLEEDAENAAVLDRNAARLAAVTTSQGRLRVERIPMGRKDDGIWRTYTNCIYANGVLVIPAYHAGGDNGRLEQAYACYRRLLVNWRIAAVDTSALIQEGGSLHCASLNVVGFAKPFAPIPFPVPAANPVVVDARTRHTNAQGTP